MDKLSITDKIKKAILSKFNTKKTKLKVGFFENSQYETGEYVASVAFWNEYGTISKKGERHIPPRPFMRNALENEANRKKWGAIVKDLAGQGKKEDAIAEMLGGIIVGDIQTEITDGTFEKLAPSTIAKKGDSKPLIDTSFMISQVAFRVEK